MNINASTTIAGRLQLQVDRGIACALLTWFTMGIVTRGTHWKKA